MPDDRTLPPANWGDAFAALPLETPDAGAWQRIARVHARPRRALHRTGWAAAIAATVAAIVLWSMPLSRQERAADSHPVAQAERAPATVAPTRPHDTSDEKAANAAPAETRIAGTPAQAPSPTPTTRETNSPRTPAATATTPDAIATRAASDKARDREQAVASAPAIETADTASPASTDPLESLYAESAQLEAVLAMARDERVSSGAAAALASDFDAQVASIDAELIQPGITDARRLQLWRDRVDTLRQITTFESTRRLLAAQGERYDARLVSID